MDFWDYFKAIVAITAIIAAAFYVTRLLAKINTGGLRKNTTIKLLGSLPLAKDKSISVVEIGDYAYILGVGGQRVERLDKIPAAELDISNEETAPIDFSENFREILMSKFKKPVGR